MGCKYLTETKEALDCRKNKVLPPPLASFYFQRYVKVHWVVRTDFIVKHETFLGLSSEKLFRWQKNNGTQRTELKLEPWSSTDQSSWRPAWPTVLSLCLCPHPGHVTVPLLLAGTKAGISKADRGSYSIIQLKTTDQAAELLLLQKPDHCKHWKLLIFLNIGHQIQAS